MTGFGRGEASNEEHLVVVEIKSVNHRFKDVRARMPNVFNALENNLRQRLGERFRRGSFDLSIHLKRAEGKSRFDDVDEAKVEAFLTRMKTLSAKSGVELHVDPTAFLRSEFQREQELDKDPTLPKLLDQAFESAMNALEESRKQEGDKLKKVMADHQSEYNKYFDVVESGASEFKAAVEERLRKKLQEISKEIKIDEPRYLQEIVYYLEKMDVHEEINRVKAHMQKFTKLLADGGEAGRQVDFLVQELGRETNTIGSKSTTEEISQAVVQMKVQLEKIREQGLNLE